MWCLPSLTPGEPKKWGSVVSVGSDGDENGNTVREIASAALVSQLTYMVASVETPQSLCVKHIKIFSSYDASAMITRHLHPAIRNQYGTTHVDPSLYASLWRLSNADMCPKVRRHCRQSTTHVRCQIEVVDTE